MSAPSTTTISVQTFNTSAISGDYYDAPIQQLPSHFAFPLWWPAPLSPVFQPGGALEGFNEELTLIVGALVVFALVDFVFLKPRVSRAASSPTSSVSSWKVIAASQLFPAEVLEALPFPLCPNLPPAARFPILHVVGSAAIAIAALPDVLRLFVTDDPVLTTRGPACTMVAQCVAVALYIYHTLGFPLLWWELYHHAVFVPTLFVVGLGAKSVGGAMMNCASFFICGFPTMIAQILVALGQLGWITRRRQQLVAVAVHQWVRMPGIICVVCATWYGFRVGDCDAPPAVALVGCLFIFYNANLYLRGAYGRCARYLARGA